MCPKYTCVRVGCVADHFSIVVYYFCWRQLRAVCHVFRNRWRWVGGDVWGRDLNENKLAADNGRQQSSKESVACVRYVSVREYTWLLFY